MKQITCIVIALLLSTGIAEAQHINIGIKGGLNAYTILGNNMEYSPYLSYHAGLLGHMHMNTNFAFQPEVVYSVQGTTYKVGSIDNILKVSYVNIPLNFQYMFDNGFRIQAGPQLGILTGASFVIGDVVTDTKASYKSTDISATVGISYVKPATGFGIDIRYNHGFTNINSTSIIDSYNRGMQLGLFFLFQHK